MKTHTLGKEERLKSRKLIDQLFKTGKGFSVYPFRVYYLVPPPQQKQLPVAGVKPVTTPASLLQFGVGVSTKNFKHAVDRNRVKRVTREAYRLQKEALRQAVQLKQLPFVIFFIYTGKELPEYQLVTEKVAVILNRLQKIVHEIPAAHT